MSFSKRALMCVLRYNDQKKKYKTSKKGLLCAKNSSFKNLNHLYVFKYFRKAEKIIQL